MAKRDFLSESENPFSKPLEMYQTSLSEEAYTPKVKAEDALYWAWEWIQDNPLGWEDIVYIAQEVAEKNSENYISVNGVIGYLRNAPSGWKKGDDEEYKFNSVLDPAFSRFLSWYYPEMGIRQKKAKCDPEWERFEAANGGDEC